MTSVAAGEPGVANELGPEDEQARRRRGRSIAIALILGGLVILFYVATIVRLGGNALNKM